MTKPSYDLMLRIGGPQGTGIETVAALFSRACAAAGFQVFGRREYHSNIMGRHTYSDLRVSTHALSCHRDDVNVLVAFEAETLARHVLSLVSGGLLVHDSKDEDVELARMTFLAPRLRDELEKRLSEQGLPLTAGGMVEAARTKMDIQIVSVPYRRLLEEIRQRLALPHVHVERVRNTLALAVACALLRLPANYVHQAIAKIFPQPELMDMNHAALEVAYEYINQESPVGQLTLRLPEQQAAESHVLVNGIQSVALGKLAGGLSFQTYYPISPASDESVYLEAHDSVPLKNGQHDATVVIQTEDELAAITMACGAALTGARCATVTSGPGFSLMTEGLGWAGMNEVPLVVTLYQRGGPSTGMPTRTEQGDLLFVIHAGHGEFPRLVLASGDINEAFYDAAQAFDYAERYQTPVIHLLDKALASTTQTVTPFRSENLHIERGTLNDTSQSGDEPYPRFAPTASGITPRPLLGQPGARHWLTGVEHNIYGRVAETPAIREQMVEKRGRKLEQAILDIPLEEKFATYGDPDAALTLLSWGSTKGALIETLERLDVEGIQARFIQVRLLCPFPTADLTPLLEGATPLVVVESNYSGQFAQLLQMHTGRACDYLVVKYNGRPPSGQAVFRAVKEILAGGSPTRITLRNPYE